MGSLVLSGVVLCLGGCRLGIVPFSFSGVVRSAGAAFGERDAAVRLACDSGTVIGFFNAAATGVAPLPGGISVSKVRPVQSTGALVSQFKTGTKVFLGCKGFSQVTFEKKAMLG
jgi:hypothetical protein